MANGMYDKIKPTFLIVGAMRAGTTSLHYFLSQHPDVFMPARKELRFFAHHDGRPTFRGPGDDRLNKNWVTTWNEYCDCFADVQNETVIGEASPFYLCSSGAAERIKRYLPNVKLIILLREPSSRAFSSFQFLRRKGREPLSDFAAALAAEKQRQRDNWEFLWHYRTAGLYSEQVNTYLKLFPRKQLWIGTYDDFVEDQIGVVQSIFRFLGIDDTFEPKIAARPNLSGVPKFATVDRILTTNNPLRSCARAVVPRGFRQSIQTFLAHKNLDRVTVPSNVERELKAFYKTDIDQLETLIERDLSIWKA